MRGPNRREVTPRVLDRFSRYVASVKWTFAKTMPHIPHWYTVRPKYGGAPEDAFCDAVELIREYGYEVTWGKAQRVFVKFDLNGMCYWTMGCPLDETVIINRGALPSDTPYTRYREPALWPDEQNAILEAVGDLSGQVVLDASPNGCWVLDHLSGRPGAYEALEPDTSQWVGMLDRLEKAHPMQCTITGYAGRSVDVALDLFGRVMPLGEQWRRHFVSHVRRGGRWIAAIPTAEWGDAPELGPRAEQVVGRYTIIQGAVR